MSGAARQQGGLCLTVVLKVVLQVVLEPALAHRLPGTAREHELSQGMSVRRRIPLDSPNGLFPGYRSGHSLPRTCEGSQSPAREGASKEDEHDRTGSQRYE